MPPRRRAPTRRARALLAAAWAAAPAARAGQRRGARGAAPAAWVTVEEGGVAVLPCAGLPPDALLGCVAEPLPGMAAMAEGGSFNASAVRVNATHCACSLPPADAEAAVRVAFEAEGAAPRYGGRVLYTALWTTALARRPYLSTDSEAHVVVGVHASVDGAAVALLSLPSRRPLLGWTPVPAGVATTVPFPLAALPPVGDAQLALLLRRASGGPPLERQLFFSRVAPPPATVGSFVQVDYARRSLLVNGRPLLGVGYYDSQTIGAANMSRQGHMGINWNMRYLTSNDPAAPYVRLSDNFTQDYLDWSHAAGVHVMFDLHTEFEMLVGQGNSSGLWSNISGIVRKFRDHPALLGWYICDDCMYQWLIRQRKAKTPTVDTVYRSLKELDPYHPAIGAVESANVYVFTTRNVVIPAPSLDVVMFENYAGDLAQNAHAGDAVDPGADGALGRWPLTWEPVVNCPGPFAVVRRKDLPREVVPRILYSFSWLSVVVARNPAQLHFRLFPFGTQREDALYETVMHEVGRYARVAREVADFLLAPPSGAPEPWLSPAQAGGDGGARAALWRRSSGRTPAAFCAMVAVVNTRNVSVSTAFRLQGADPWPGAADAALAPVRGSVGRPVGVDGGAVTALVGADGFRGGKLTVFLAAFDTGVWSTGCSEDIDGASVA